MEYFKRPIPIDKARNLLEIYGTQQAAYHCALNRQKGHEEGTVSHRYWSDVLAALSRAPRGKPHTRAEKRSLRKS